MGTKETNPTIDILKKMLELYDQTTLENLIAGIRDKRYRYLVTLDMGCGGTSCAVSTFSNPPSLHQFEYCEVNTDGEWTSPIAHMSIPTMIGYDEDAEPVIGTDALDCGPVAENFKEVPAPETLRNRVYDFGELGVRSLRKIWADYFRTVFRTSVQKAKNMYPDINAGNIIFVVAHPASREWEEYLWSYRELISKSTELDPCQIITFSEAKAAMQYVKSYRKIQADWSKGVLAIDLGASTIDVAFLKRGIGAPIECSIKMAGQQVDRLLGHAILETLYPEELAALPADVIPGESFFEAHWDDLHMKRSFFSYVLRQGKESICTLGHEQFPAFVSEHEISYSMKDLRSLLRGRRFTFQCTDPGLDAFLNNGTNRGFAKNTWYGHLEKLISYMILERIPNELKNRGFSGRYKIDKIVATGGTANLVGVDDAIRNGMGAALSQTDDCIILNEPADYERTVPYGSTAYIQNVISGIDTLLEAPETIRSALKKDLTKISPDIIQKACTPPVEHAVNKVLDWWRDSDFRTRYSGSISRLRYKLKNEIKIEQSELDTALQKAEGSIREKAQITGNDNSNMQETYASIQKILQELAHSKTIEETIEIGNLHLRLDNSRMSAAVRRSAPDSYYDYIDSKSLLVLIGKSLILLLSEVADTPIPKSMRAEIVYAMKNNSPFQSELHPEIIKAFEENFEESKGFGIDKQIMTVLENKIINAMFLSSKLPK